jgi:hypothetical protein
MPLEEIRLFLLENRNTTVSVLHHQSSSNSSFGGETHLGDLIGVPGRRHAVTLKWEIVSLDLVEAERSKAVVGIYKSVP